MSIIGILNYIPYPMCTITRVRDEREWEYARITYDAYLVSQMCPSFRLLISQDPVNR